MERGAYGLKRKGLLGRPTPESGMAGKAAVICRKYYPRKCIPGYEWAWHKPKWQAMVKARRERIQKLSRISNALVEQMDPRPKWHWDLIEI